MFNWFRSIFSQNHEQRSYQVLVDAANANMILGNDYAMRVASVFACVRVLAETLAQLPLDVYRRLGDDSREIAKNESVYKTLHDKPNPWQTSYEFREQMMYSLLLSGNAIAIIKVRRGKIELWPVYSSRLQKIERNTSGRLVYTIINDNGSPQEYFGDELLHVRGPTRDGIYGMTPISFLRSQMTSAYAADEHSANTWKNGAKPSIVLQTDQILPPGTAEKTRDFWQKLYGGSKNAGKTAVLEAGLKVHEMGLNHVDLQFIESQKLTTRQIASCFRVPLHMLGDLEHATFSNIEHQDLEFKKYTISPWIQRWEQSIQRDLLDDDDNLYAEFNAEGLLRTDTAGRAQFYREMFNIGVLNVNEIRKFENFNSVEGGDKRFVNAALVDLEKAGDPTLFSMNGQVGESPASEDVKTSKNNDEKPKEDAKNAAKRAWDAEIESLIRWECDALTRFAKKPSTFLPECEKFLDEHRDRTERKLERIADICHHVGVDVNAAVYAAEHRSAVWSMVLESANGTAAELASRVDVLVEKIKAKGII